MRRRNTPLDTWLHIGSLAATAWFVWVNSVSPRLGHMSFALILYQAFDYILIGCGAAVLLALCVYVTVSRGSVQRQIHEPWEALGVAVWYAPAMLLAGSFTPASMAVSLLLVLSATRLLAMRWLADAPRERLGYTPGRVLAWRMAMAGVASVAIHAGVVAIGAGLVFPAAISFAVSAAILTSLAVVTGALSRRREMALPHAALGALLTLLLAAGITMVRYGSGSVVAEENETADADKADDGFPGVILDAGRRAGNARIAPPDVALAPHALDFSKPVEIPFTGEYWLFRPPYRRPPSLSFHRDGTPADVWFSTTDGRPLAMEAEQLLADPLPLDCCARIDVAVSGRELPVDTNAYLQLQLMDTRWNNYYWLNLGIVRLQGTGTETVGFEVPPPGMIRSFDKMRVVFHPPRTRASQSMRIKIDRFVLIPKRG